MSGIGQIMEDVSVGQLRGQMQRASSRARKAESENRDLKANFKQSQKNWARAKAGGDVLSEVIKKTWIPRLLKAGVSQEEIDQIRNEINGNISDRITRRQKEIMKENNIPE